MHYVFSIKDAEEYGLDEAVMLYNFKYWIVHNKANNKNYFDGRTWTYNSVNAFNKLFPFWSERQISRVLKSLINKGILITGNYNKVAYDRTLWYAFKDESILPNGDMETTERSNRTPENVTPIPYINTDKKQDINKTKKTEDTDEQFNLFWNVYDNKKGKYKTFTLWSKLSQADRDEVVLSVPNYLLYLKSKNLTFKYNPENYIKDRRYKDYLVVEKKKFVDQYANM